jgi:WD40 repeat protein
MRWRSYYVLLLVLFSAEVVVLELWSRAPAPQPRQPVGSSARGAQGATCPRQKARPGPWRLVPQIGHPTVGSVEAVAFSDDCSLLASVGYAGDVKIWEHASGLLRASFRTRELPWGRDWWLHWSRNGQELYVTSDDGHAQINTSYGLDAGGRESIVPEPQHLYYHRRWLRQLPRDRAACRGANAGAGEDGRVAIRDRKGSLLRPFPTFDGLSGRVDFSPDGRWLMARHPHRTFVWNLIEGRVQSKLGEPGSLVGDPTWSGESIVTWVIGGLLWWRPEDGSELRALAGSDFHAFVVSPDTRYVVSQAFGKGRIRDLNTGRDAMLAGHGFAWNPDSKRLLSVTIHQPELDRPDTGDTHSSKNCDLGDCAVCELKQWDVATGSPNGSGLSIPCTASRYRDSPVPPTLFSPDGRTIAVRNDDVISLVDVASWTVRAAHASACGDPAWAFSPDGETIALGCDSILFWNVRTGALRKRLSAPTPRPAWVAYSADGTVVAVDDGPVSQRLIRISDGASLSLTIFDQRGDQPLGLVSDDSGRWTGNPEVARHLRLRREGDIRRAELRPAEPLPEFGWRPSLLADFLAGR